MSKFLPMLAAEAVLGQITYPKLASAKANGVRGSVVEGRLMARSLKRITNRWCQTLYDYPVFSGLEGELIVGSVGAKDVFSRTSSGVTSVDGVPNVRMHLFDLHDLPKLEYRHRYDRLVQRFGDLPKDRFVLLLHRLINSDAELQEFHDECVGLGYEGVVLRNLGGLYKYGRSTELEGDFLRYVEWIRSEARILAVHEQRENTNAQTINELGRSKRSLHQAGMVGKNTAGSLTVEDIYDRWGKGVTFNVGTSTEAEAQWIWDHRQEVLGRVIMYKCRAPTKIKPRFPQMEGFRSPLDMS